MYGASDVDSGFDSKKCQAQKKPCEISDSGGSYLQITPTGGKYWRLKYRIDDKEKLHAIGAWPEVTLAFLSLC
jgi:hypothetical protein